MDRLYPVESHVLLELRHGVGVARVRAQVVSGREQMTGVEAHPDRRGAAGLGVVDDRSQLLERVAEVSALTGGVLE